MELLKGFEVLRWHTGETPSSIHLPQALFRKEIVQTPGIFQSGAHSGTEQEVETLGTIVPLK